MFLNPVAIDNVQELADGHSLNSPLIYLGRRMVQKLMTCISLHLPAEGEPQVKANSPTTVPFEAGAEGICDPAVSILGGEEASD